MIRRIFTPRFAYDNELDQQRAVGLQALVVVLLALLGLLTFGLIVAQAGLIPQTGSLPPLDFGLAGALLVMGAALAAVYMLLQRGHLDWASWVLVGMLVMGTLIPITNYEFEPIYLLIPLIAAGVLLNRRGLVITMLLLGVGILARYSAVSQLDTPIRVIPSREIGLATFQAFNITIFIFILLYVFGGLSIRLSREMVRNFQRLQRVTSLTPRFAAAASEDELMGRAMQAAQEDLGYALAQIYLTDASGHINRRVRRGTSLQAILSTTGANPGETEVVAEAAQTGQAVLVSDRDGEPRARHLVAPARRAVSLPVVFSNGQTAAVLDIQSTSVSAPGAGELTVLTALAQSLASAWEKLAVTADQTRIISDQAAQVERLREQVGTLEGRARQTVTQSWEGYLHGRGDELIGFDMVRQQGVNERDLRAASDLPPDLRVALETGEPQITVEDSEQVVNIPIHVRNTLMGAMTFRVPADQLITARQMETSRIVAERLGLALESTRLYEQYQAQARRERKASEVTGVLLGATDLNRLLNAAASAFNEALGAVSTRVTIEPAAIAPPAGNGGHSNGSQGGH